MWTPNKDSASQAHISLNTKNLTPTHTHACLVRFTYLATNWHSNTTHCSVVTEHCDSQLPCLSLFTPPPQIFRIYVSFNFKPRPCKLSQGTTMVCWSGFFLLCKGPRPFKECLKLTCVLCVLKWMKSTLSQNDDDGVVKMNWCVISNGCSGMNTSSAVRSK